jgi:hypothetical protein
MSNQSGERTRTELTADDVRRDDAILTQKLTHRRNAGKSGTNQGILTKRGRLSTVRLLINIACFVKEKNNFLNVKSK